MSGIGGIIIIETLKRDSQFRQVYDRGCSKASPYLVVFWLENNLDYSRYGFTISKKIGSAVERNRRKRQLKEIVRRWLSPLIKTGYDVVFIARPWIKKLNFYEMKKDMQKLLENSNLLKNSRQK